MCPIFKNLLVLYPTTCPSFQADCLHSELNLLNSSLVLGVPIYPVKAAHCRFVPEWASLHNWITPVFEKCEKSPVLLDQLGHETC